MRSHISVHRVGITSCKPTPRTYPHDAQLDYFRIADDSG